MAVKWIVFFAVYNYIANTVYHGCSVYSPRVFQRRGGLLKFNLKLKKKSKSKYK